MIIVEIAGHLGADPEVRFTPSGQKVTTFRVATNVRRKGKDETVWWRVTIWGDRFDKMVPYFKKGSAIIAIGEMSPPEIWERDGKQHITLELTADIIRFSPFGKSDRPAQDGSAPYGAKQQQPHDHAYAEPYSPGPSVSAAAASNAPSFSSAGKFDGGYPAYSANEHEEDNIPF